jgi:hypothetical protein
MEMYLLIDFRLPVALDPVPAWAAIAAQIYPESLLLGDG